jgi:Protein of unknown function (DUF732)
MGAGDEDFSSKLRDSGNHEWPPCHNVLRTAARRHNRDVAAPRLVAKHPLRQSRHSAIGSTAHCESARITGKRPINSTGSNWAQVPKIRIKNPIKRNTEVNRSSPMIRKILVGAAGAVIAVGLAAPANASPVPPPNPSVPAFLGAARAAGITGVDPAMLEDGYAVCYSLWAQHMPGTQVAAGLVQDHPTLTSQQAGQFVLAAYHDLCPVASDVVDYWAYSTGGAGGGAGGG